MIAGSAGRRRGIPHHQLPYRTKFACSSTQRYRARGLAAAYDAERLVRAPQVLRCSGGVEWLEARGALMLRVNEKPNLKASERRTPIPWVRPGRLTQHKLKYIRHATVTLFAVLNVFDARMRGSALGRERS